MYKLSQISLGATSLTNILELFFDKKDADIVKIHVVLFITMP